MDTTAVVVAIVIAIVVIVVVVLLRDRLSELTVDGSKAKMKSKMDAKLPDVLDEKPTGVVVKTAVLIYGGSRTLGKIMRDARDCLKPLLLTKRRFLCLINC